MLVGAVRRSVSCCALRLFTKSLIYHLPLLLEQDMKVRVLSLTLAVVSNRRFVLPLSTCSPVLQTRRFATPCRTCIPGDLVRKCHYSYRNIFRWGGGLPREGVGPKKFSMLLETQGNQTLGQDIPQYGATKGCNRTLATVLWVPLTL